jgi:hypothetical protein
MNRQAFVQLVRDLTATFNRKPPATEVLDRWHTKVQHIPDEAVKWITEQLEERDDLPKNFPGAVNGLWYRWRENNPGKCRADEGPQGCRYCLKGQIYYVAKVKGGKWYSFVAICGHCMPPTTGIGMPRLTIEQIQARGYEWTEPGKTLTVAAIRNREDGQARGGADFSGRLDAWRRGDQPDEREPVPDDERADIAEGWK